MENGHDVGGGDSDERNETENSSGDRNNLDPVDRAGDGWSGCVGGKLARDPGLNLLSRLRAGLPLDRISSKHGATAYPLVKSKRIGCEPSFALGPTVGWK